MVHRNVDDYAVGAFSYHPTHFIIQTMKCYIRNFSLVRAVNVNAVGVLTKNYKDYPTRFIIQTMKYYNEILHMSFFFSRWYGQWFQCQYYQCIDKHIKMT